jgi:hypothetical protein
LDWPSVIILAVIALCTLALILAVIVFFRRGE